MTRKFSYVSRPLALTTMCVGILVIIGWILGIRELKSVMPYYKNMKFNAAICFVLISIAAFILSKRRKTRRHITAISILTGIVIAANLTFLYQAIFDVTLGVDEWLFADTESQHLYPGRVAPIAAVNFILLGISILLAQNPRHYRVYQTASIVVFFISLFAIAGYIYNISYLYGDSAYSQLALHAAFCFLLLSVSILFIYPDKGIMRLLAHPDSVGKSARILVPAALILPMALGWIRLQGEHAGLYDTNYGTVLFSIIIVIFFCAVILWSVHYIIKTEDREKQTREELTAKTKYIARNRERINRIVTALNEISHKNFKITVPLSQENDELDSIASNINMLSSEMGIYVAQLKKANEEIERNHERFFKIFHHSPEPRCITRISDGKFLHVNKAFLKTFERENEEIIGKTSIDINMVSADERLRITELLKSGNGKTGVEMQLQLPGNKTREVIAFTEITEIDGEQCFLSNYLDISERKKAEAQIQRFNDELKEKNAELKIQQDTIKQASDFLNIILENIPNMIFVKEAEELRFIRFNKAGEELLGFPRQDLLDKNDYDLFSKEQADFFIEKDREVLRDKKLLDIPEEIIQTREQGARWLHTKKIPIFDDSGKPIYLLGISEDITEQKKTSEQLQLFNQELHLKNEELEAQQEELRKANEELEEYTQKLKEQQEELEMTNEEIEEHRNDIEQKNNKLEAAYEELDIKARQLETTNKYKSEFLANMSHELRSPLNSLLILANDLAENREANLTGEQVESARIINQSGHELLSLINDILDLSKIEAGKMQILREHVNLQRVAEKLNAAHAFMARLKNLEFTVTIDKDTPAHVLSDEQRLSQILKNLVGNAFKFTPAGKVSVRFFPYDKNHIAISVTDTGIGISKDKQQLIFEAFRQAEGGTSRQYGGTGLGLSIVRQLARLLHGEISLESDLGTGSVFTVIIPHEQPPGENTAEPVVYDNENENEVVSDQQAVHYTTIPDDRTEIIGGDKVLLIIEDDGNFARTLKSQANKKGFKCIISATGEDGLLLAKEYKPNAIILDINLPGINGNVVLSELKKNPALRHIPVHVMSAFEQSIASRKGIMHYLTKPVTLPELENAFGRIEEFISRKVKNLLLVEDDVTTRQALKKLIGNGDVYIFEAGTIADAHTILETQKVDCIVLDLLLPDKTGFDLVDELQQKPGFKLPPVIIYTGKDLTEEEVHRTREFAESIIVKSEKSEDRLLDETALFLHRTISNMPESKHRIFYTNHNHDDIFKNKRVLIVDDDMRNVFALSKILKENGMQVFKAESGYKALEIIESGESLDLVLMDIMMPGMDGYEAMRRIRNMDKHKNLPIIALTAKAMKDDRQKCIEAGANDYYTKPVDIDKLLTLMRIWIK